MKLQKILEAISTSAAGQKPLVKSQCQAPAGNSDVAPCAPDASCPPGFKRVMRPDGIPTARCVRIGAEQPKQRSSVAGSKPTSTTGNKPASAPSSIKPVASATQSADDHKKKTFSDPNYKPDSMVLAPNVKPASKDNLPKKKK